MGFKDAGFSSLDDKSFHVLLGAVFQSTYVEETVFFGDYFSVDGRLLSL